MNRTTLKSEHSLTDYFDNLMQEFDANPAPNANGKSIEISRRSFIKLTGIFGGGLVLGFSIGGKQALANTSAGSTTFNAYVQITPEGKIIIQAKNPEIGQGVKTALPMIVAEELDAAWEEVEVVQSPIDEATYGRQMAGGSRSISANWVVLREAGATVRAMLVAAAAAQLSVPLSELRTENSRVIHSASGRSLHYGDLAEAAALLETPTSVNLKATGDYRLLGRRITGVDNADIVTGKPLFGIDQQHENMSFAVYQKCPAVGGHLVSANLDQIKSLKGVKDAFILEGNGKTDELMPGVAIVATSTWAAFKAKRALEIVWDESDASKDSWSAFTAQAQELAANAPVRSLSRSGNVEQSMNADGNKSVEAFYTHNFVLHAPLEPQNTTVLSKADGSIEIWAPTQTPGRALTGVANTLGISQDQITLHQTRAGGGFGRRLTNDPVCEAAAIARRVDGPVKLQWTREDDTQHDFNRVGGFHVMKGAVDKDGKMVAYSDHLISFTENGRSPVSGGNLRMTGYPEDACSNVLMGETLLPLKITCGAFRAPASNTIAWAQQSFIAELAHAAQRDQYEFLLETLYALPEPRGEMLMNKYRAIDTVRLAAEKAGWGRLVPAGRGLGIAFYYSHRGHIAEVAEVSVDENRKVTVYNVTVAADVGPIVNRSTSENLLEGAVIDGISTMMGLSIEFENGRVFQENFHQYPILRMPKTPNIAVHFIESNYHPTGLGEPGLPPLAPAVGNAIFAASGIRARTMPLSKEGFSI